MIELVKITLINADREHVRAMLDKYGLFLESLGVQQYGANAELRNLTEDQQTAVEAVLNREGVTYHTDWDWDD